jgi:hypothetical protein
VEIIDDELEPMIPQDPTAIEEVTFIPFEDFQKTLQ